MTNLRRPRPFLRFSRSDYEKLLDGLYDQRDFAIGQARAAKDRAAALIEAAADGHAQDARHLDRLAGAKGGTEKLTAAGHRAVEMALRAVARDIDDGGPEMPGDEATEEDA